jgi:hypothetical protein
MQVQVEFYKCDVGLVGELSQKTDGSRVLGGELSTGVGNSWTAMQKTQGSEFVCFFAKCVREIRELIRELCSRTSSFVSDELSIISLTRHFAELIRREH